MIEDIRLLCQEHSDILIRQSAGKSLCGRDIPLLILGNPEADWGKAVPAMGSGL